MSDQIENMKPRRMWTLAELETAAGRVLERLAKAHPHSVHLPSRDDVIVTIVRQPDLLQRLVK